MSTKSATSATKPGRKPAARHPEPIRPPMPAKPVAPPAPSKPRPDPRPSTNGAIERERLHATDAGGTVPVVPNDSIDDVIRRLARDDDGKALQRDVVVWSGDEVVAVVRKGRGVPEVVRVDLAIAEDINHSPEVAGGAFGNLIIRRCLLDAERSRRFVDAMIETWEASHAHDLAVGGDVGRYGPGEVGDRWIEFADELADAAEIALWSAVQTSCRHDLVTPTTPMETIRDLDAAVFDTMDGNLVLVAMPGRYDRREVLQTRSWNCLQFQAGE